MLTTILIVISAVLSALLLGVMARLIHIKREIRRFSREITRLKDESYRQPVKVTCFDKDIVAAANAMNDTVSYQRSLALSSAEEKKELANIIAGISHDFRTPMTAALGYLQLLEKSSDLSERDRKHLAVAIEKNTYLKELSDDFFEISKLENENEQPVNEQVNLSNLVSEVILEQYGWIEGAGIQAEFDISDGIVVSSDIHKLRRILSNLFSNAQKYTRSCISAELTAWDGGAVFTLSNDVEDKGSIEITKVFSAFYRASSRNKNGSGLGLYVVKTLCDSMGFEVTASFDESDKFSVKLVIRS